MLPLTSTSFVILVISSPDAATPVIIISVSIIATRKPAVKRLMRHSSENSISYRKITPNRFDSGL